MAVIEISILPVGTPSSSLSEYIAACVRILDGAEGVTYRLGPMSTVIEGELEHVWPVVRRMHEQPFMQGVPRVVTTVRIDDRRDKTLTMAGKVAAVEARLRQERK